MSNPNTITVNDLVVAGFKNVGSYPNGDVQAVNKRGIVRIKQVRWGWEIHLVQAPKWDYHFVGEFGSKQATLEAARKALNDDVATPLPEGYAGPDWTELSLVAQEAERPPYPDDLVFTSRVGYSVKLQPSAPQRSDSDVMLTVGIRSVLFDKDQVDAVVAYLQAVQAARVSHE